MSIQNHTETEKTEGNALKKVHAVFVDDEQYLLDSYRFLAYNKKIDTYQDPKIFLSHLHQYPKNTKIFLDHQFINYSETGCQIGEQLGALGFTKLYLFSGDIRSKKTLPANLTLILKCDLPHLQLVLEG